jgi:hypothetical protein
LLTDFLDSLAKILRYLPTIRVKKIGCIFQNSSESV